jgi:hypothetical protein
MSVKEASGVCKDRVKWRAICRGKNNGRWFDMLLAYPVRDYSVMICMYVCMYVYCINVVFMTHFTFCMLWSRMQSKSQRKVLWPPVFYYKQSRRSVILFLTFRVQHAHTVYYVHLHNMRERNTLILTCSVHIEKRNNK